MRSFIAIDIEEPDVVKRIVELGRLLNSTGAKMKLVEPENLHITIRFLGEISEKDVPILKSVLEKHAKDFQPFTITLRGLGAFPTIGRPRVVWIGVSQGADKLQSLASAINSEIDKLGFRRDKEEFVPHVTVARVKHYNSALVELIRRNVDIEIGSIEVKSVRLKKSKLTPSGPIYTTLVDAKLGSS